MGTVQHTVQSLQEDLRQVEAIRGWLEAWRTDPVCKHEPGVNDWRVEQSLGLDELHEYALCDPENPDKLAYERPHIFLLGDREHLGMAAYRSVPLAMDVDSKKVVMSIPAWRQSLRNETPPVSFIITKSTTS